jgi:hypothetical protein
MEEAFRALLLADAGVTAITAAINWGEHPQGAAWPGVVLHRISGAGAHTLDGPDGLLRARVQVDCIALTYAQAVALSRAVVAALDGYATPPFQAVFHSASRDLRDAGSAGAAERPFRVSCDFTVLHNS